MTAQLKLLGLFEKCINLDSPTYLRSRAQGNALKTAPNEDLSLTIRHGKVTKVVGFRN